MTNRKQQTVAILFAIGLVLSSGALGIVSAANVDTSTTDATTTTSDLQADDTIDGFNASSDVTSTVQVNVSRHADPNMRILLNSSGVVFAKNTSMENISAAGDATTGDMAHWNGSFKHSLLADVPMDADDNVTMDMEIYNGTNTSDTLVSFQFNLNSTNERAVIYVGDDETDEDVTTDTEAETETEERALGLLSEQTSSTVEHDNLGIDGDATTVYVVFDNDTVSDSYSDALDRKWFGQSSYDAEEYVKYHQLYVEGNPHLIFNEEAPEAVVDNEDFTHGVFTEVDGKDAIEVTLGEKEYEDETTIDVVSHGNDAYGFIQNQQNRYANLMAGR